MRTQLALLVCLLSCVVAACDAGTPSVEDASVDLTCVLDRECQDGVFCNGEERCMPGATDANERGCVLALGVTCPLGYGCDEEERFCRIECASAADGDGDGHVAVACGGDDCDDADPNRFPGNTEVCDAESHDEDCNLETFGFVDQDGDGSALVTCCNQDDETELCGDDCNDADSLINPRAGEACDRVDNNCDGLADENCPCMPGTSEVCGSTEAGDCQLGRRLCIDGILGECIGAIYEAEEICDGNDNDCDGQTDEATLRTYYEDQDGDGYGVAASTRLACSVPDGWASNPLDCDDARTFVNPAVPESCNALDDDCDGDTDEGLERTFYLDDDGDGFGATASASVACTPPSAEHTERGGDCDDASAARSPVGLEACNGADDDCDTSTDEGVLRTYYLDADGDGVGGLTTQSACSPPTNYVALGGDCADSNAARYPGRFDACNGVDDDCNGSIDPGCDCEDGDTQTNCGPATGMGECVIGTQLCIGGQWGECVGAVATSPETCDGRDEDCDGVIDNGVRATGCFADADADTYGTGIATTQCRDAARPAHGFCPAGYTNRGGDCNDSDASVRPGTTEACNGRDDDCTGSADDGMGMVCIAGSSRAGVGNNGFCASVPGTYQCVACTSEVFTASPPAETCNGLDDDCDGAVDDAFSCVRNSTAHACVTGCGTVGTRSCSASCSFVGQTCSGVEVCNGCDDDANGTPDNGFGCVLGSVQTCSRTCGAATLMGTRRCLSDCSGYSACTLAEQCNGCDDDGDGTADNGFFCPQNSVSFCTTPCGTPGQRVCNGSCSAFVNADCRAVGETCNYCDDDGDGNIWDDRPLATTFTDEEPVCETLTTTSAVLTCPPPFPIVYSGTHLVALVNGTASDAGAAWSTGHNLGWGRMRASYIMQVSKPLASALPADGWAIILSDGGSGTLGGVGGGLGVPMTRTGIAVEWRFYGGDPNVDQVDTLTVRRLTGAGSGDVLAAGVPVPASADFGVGDTTLRQRLSVEYTPDDPATTTDNEELLEVFVAGQTAALIQLVGGYGDPLTGELSAGAAISIGVTAATGGRTFTGAISLGRTLENPVESYFEFERVCY
jgi:hypothetical protein